MTNPVGRPSKFPEKHKAILRDIALGLTIEDACALNDITPETLKSWRDNNDDFLREYNSAVLKFKKYHLNLLKKAATTGTKETQKREDYGQGVNTITKYKVYPQFSQWLLKVRFPDEFADRAINKVEVTNKENVQDLSDDDLEAEIKHLEQAAST